MGGDEWESRGSAARHSPSPPGKASQGHDEKQAPRKCPRRQGPAASPSRIQIGKETRASGDQGHLSETPRGDEPSVLSQAADWTPHGCVPRLASASLASSARTVRAQSTHRPLFRSLVWADQGRPDRKLSLGFSVTVETGPWGCVGSNGILAKEEA